MQKLPFFLHYPLDWTQRIVKTNDRHQAKDREHFGEIL